MAHAARAGTTKSIKLARRAISAGPTSSPTTNRTPMSISRRAAWARSTTRKRRSTNRPTTRGNGNCRPPNRRFSTILMAPLPSFPNWAKAVGRPAQVPFTIIPPHPNRQPSSQPHSTARCSSSSGLAIGSKRCGWTSITIPRGSSRFCRASRFPVRSTWSSALMDRSTCWSMAKRGASTPMRGWYGSTIWLAIARLWLSPRLTIILAKSH